VSESPFLPSTQIQFAWDSTSLGLLKECPRKYYLTMIEGWRGKGQSMHLTFGIEFHKALEEYDLHRAAGQDDEDATISAVTDLLIRTYGWETGDTKKNRDTLVRSVIWYLAEYKDDVAKTVILKSGKPAVELSFRFETNFQVPGTDVSYMLSGHMDRLGP
jgi:hypothetical protein